MAPDVIIYISNGLKKNVVNYISRINTNGYYLTKDIIVGLSMMCYTFLDNISFTSLKEVIDSLTRRLPMERTHRKVLYFLL